MDHADVIILGGGLVGSALAVALDAHGLTAIVIDPADPAVILAAGFDGRASAIASAPLADARGDRRRATGSRGKGCPIQGIRVSDGLEPGTLDFAPEPDDGALGHMFENRQLRTALLEAARARRPRVDLRMKTRAVSVDRGAARRRRDARFGRDGPRAAAGRGGGPQFADARGGGAQGRALEL